MAASIQERLKLKQYQVDTWTTREQLCLASAVMRSGDQNWVAVRRNIKMLTNETSRPPDWYSTKNCALQYARLLERVDTPKRKRERGDGGNETPGEIVTKMLSKQRVEELQVLEAEERTTYNQLRWEIQQLEAGKLDHQLDTFWEQLVKEHAEEEEEEQRQQQWLKEREEKITAIQQALKHQGPKVPQPPHKKKPKSQVGGGCGGVAESRRSSGLSETSSEVDSAVESPDLNEVTSESLVSNKSQDENGGGESEARPTPTSPLLSSLLSKSPITGIPGAASSPLAQLGIGSRAMRGLGISPVSEGLRNLVSSAISGTNTSDKDKPTHAASNTGTSTLSLLLDLPPSTPGGPLPRLSDLPGPSYEHKEHEGKKSDSSSKSEKMEESCPENKGCDEQIMVEVTPTDPLKSTESTDCVPRDGQDTKTVLEGQDTHMEEERKEATISSEGSGKETENTSVSQSTAQNPEEVNDSKKEVEPPQKEKKEEKQEPKQGDEKKVECKKEEEEKNEGKEEQEQNQVNKELSVKLQEQDTKEKEEEDSTKERHEGKKMEEKRVEESKIKTKEKCKEPESSSEEKNEGDTAKVTSLPNTSEKVKTPVEQEDPSSICTSEEGSGCKKDEVDCEKVKEHQEKTIKNEEKEVEENEDDNDEEEEREEEEEEEVATSEAEEERKNKTEDKEVEEEVHTSKKSTEEEEEEPPTKIIKTEDSALTSEGEKKPKKTVIKKEQEEDQDSKDWVSEEEGSTFGSRKRKTSGGDIVGVSSPLISESGPNSPASTHYGDDSESERAYKSWKKPIMILWNHIAAHKFASLFLRPITDDQAPGYHSVVYRPMDLQRIKRSIESGAIRTTAEFQRDIMLMFLNATMYNTRDHNVYHMAHQMMKDAVSTIQDFLTTQMLVRAEETPQKSLRRETRESSAKRSDDDSKRKRDPLDEKSLKKRRTN